MWPAGIRRVDETQSRPCRYSFALQDDSVFADFDVDKEGHVSLLRISFDGFGCCHTSSARQMDPTISASFVDLVESGNIATQHFAAILENYFAANAVVIWKDALEEHGLIRK